MGLDPESPAAALPVSTRTSPAPATACAPRGTAPTLKGLSHCRFSAKLLILPPADRGRRHSGGPLQGQSRVSCSWAPGTPEAGPGLQRAQGGQGCAVRRASRERRARLNRTANLEDSEVPPGLHVSPVGSRAPWEEPAEPGLEERGPHGAGQPTTGLPALIHPETRGPTRTRENACTRGQLALGFAGVSWGPEPACPTL